MFALPNINQKHSYMRVLQSYSSHTSPQEAAHEHFLLDAFTRHCLHIHPHRRQLTNRINKVDFGLADFTYSPQEAAHQPHQQSGFRSGRLHIFPTGGNSPTRCKVLNQHPRSSQITPQEATHQPLAFRINVI